MRGLNAITDGTDLCAYLGDWLYVVLCEDREAGIYHIHPNF